MKMKRNMEQEEPKRQERIEISEGDQGSRIDSFLNAKFPNYSRSYFQKLIEDENTVVNKKTIKPSYKLKTGDIIDVNFQKQQEMEEPKGEKIPIDIIYEDENVIVINKQAGLVVHPAAGNKKGTLVNALIEYFPEIIKAVHDESNLISKIRPGLVQRLDKDTSGVMIIAKNPKALHSLSRQIQNRKVKKIYWGLCFNWPKLEQGRLVSHLGRQEKNRRKMADIGKAKGKETISDYKVLKYLSNKNNIHVSLVQFDIKTGRTHQIRVQAKQIGCPILGDSLYGSKESLKISNWLQIQRQLLHAKRLQIHLPDSTKLITFEAPVPEDFEDVLRKFQ